MSDNWFFGLIGVVLVIIVAFGLYHDIAKKHSADAPYEFIPVDAPPPKSPLIKIKIVAHASRHGSGITNCMVIESLQTGQRGILGGYWGDVGDEFSIDRTKLEKFILEVEP